MATRTDELVADLNAARDEVVAVLDRTDPARLTQPGIIGGWSVQQLIAHLGYWAGHAAELIHAAKSGREPEGGLSREEIDARNRTVASVAATTNLATVRRREAGSFQALSSLIHGMDPQLLDLHVAGPGTLERAIREDGPEHYREHAMELKAALDGPRDAGG